MWGQPPSAWGAVWDTGCPHPLLGVSWAHCCHPPLTRRLKTWVYHCLLGGGRRKGGGGWGLSDCVTRECHARHDSVVILCWGWRMCRWGGDPKPSSFLCMECVRYTRVFTSSLCSPITDVEYYSVSMGPTQFSRQFCAKQPVLLMHATMDTV